MLVRAFRVPRPALLFHSWVTWFRGMCCRAVAWMASAAVEAPNPQTPDPTLDLKPHPTHQTPCPKPPDPSPPNQPLPLSPVSRLPFPEKEPLTHEPLPSSSLLPKAPTYEPLAGLLLSTAGHGTSPHTLCLWTLLACCTEPPMTSNFTIVRRRKALQECARRQPPHQVARYFTASSANAWAHPFCFQPH